VKTLWKKLSILARYYVVSITSFLLCWGIFSLIGFQFLNFLFFTVGFVWHFALLTPGIKDQVFARHQRLSFLSMVVRTNYYLQLFVSTEKIPFKSSIIRALSPLLFSFLLMVLTNNGNLLFTLLGSLMFELAHALLIKMNDEPKAILNSPNAPEIPPAIPPEEISRE